MSYPMICRLPQAAAWCLFSLLTQRALAQAPGAPAEKTSFQIDQPWSAAVDVRADIVMLYGIGDDFAARAAS